MSVSAGQAVVGGRGRSRASGLLVAIAAALLLAGCFGPNALLAVLAAATFLAGSMLLWRPGQPPILLYVFLIQWLQASVVVFHATLAGASVDDFSTMQGNETKAIVLTQLALICQAVGLKLGAGAIKPGLMEGARDLAQRTPLRRWFGAYLVFAMVSAAAAFAASRAPGLSQVLGGVGYLRWAFFFMLAFAFFARGSLRNPLFYIAFAAELLAGLGGYFSDFKTAFIVTLLGLVASGTRVSARFIAVSAAISAAALFLMVVWSAVKEDYRDFVSGGQAEQVVTVEYGERMKQLGALVGQLDAESLGQGADTLVRRISYVDYFGVVVDRVPSQLPYQNGAILRDAILRPFTPRLLFPGKSAIDDSLRTRQFTGMHVASAAEGTSIGVGWPAELYIDFGPWLMMPVALALGLAYGFVQRFFLNWRYSAGLLGLAISIEILLAAASIETSITKMIGGLMAGFIAAWLVARFAMPGLLPWLTGRGRQGAERAAQ